LRVVKTISTGISSSFSVGCGDVRGADREWTSEGGSEGPNAFRQERAEVSLTAFTYKSLGDTSVVDGQ